MLPTFLSQQRLKPRLKYDQDLLPGSNSPSQFKFHHLLSDTHTMTFPTGAHFLGPPQALPNNPWRRRARFPPPCRQAVLQNVETEHLKDQGSQSQAQHLSCWREPAHGLDGDQNWAWTSQQGPVSHLEFI